MYEHSALKPLNRVYNVIESFWFGIQRKLCLKEKQRLTT